jgi:3'(2'), 5'-bisphosphate nucleotidase
MRYENELAVALAAVRQASAVCRSVQSKIAAAALEKKDRSPVTVADFASQAVVCRQLLESFPDDPVIGEEDSAQLKDSGNSQFMDRVQSELAAAGIAGSPDDICDWIDRGSAKNYSPRFWTIDPIDGTKGFLRSEQYAVALALIVDGKIDVALLGCPNLPVADGSDAIGVICYAVRGQGSFVFPLDDDSAEPKRVTVSSNTDVAAARFCESVESGHTSHNHSAMIGQKLGISADAVRLDSQAKYAVVGQGQAEIYMRLPTRPGYQEKIWDHAGGVLFVEEAGGRVTDIHGKPLEFNHGFELTANRGVIATNGPLHDALLKTLPEVGVE